MDEVLRGLLCSGSRIRPNHPGGIVNISIEKEQWRRSQPVRKD